MKIVMTLLVRNEEDIIEENIEYHLSKGVDFFIVTDNLSEDNTPVLLEKYQKKGVLRVINETEDDYSQHVWVTRMARMAASDYSAGWVINNDADEFWWPHGGDLKKFFSTVPDEIFAIRVQRSNFPVLIDDNDKNFYETMILRDTRSVNPLGLPLPPKMCHRAHTEICVGQGNHVVFLESGCTVKVMNVSDGIEIFHFPVRSYEQFENKIRLGGAAYARNTVLAQSIGKTWRQLYSLWSAGKLRDEYDKAIIASDVVKVQTDQRFVVDVRLREALRPLHLKQQS